MLKDTLNHYNALQSPGKYMHFTAHNALMMHFAVGHNAQMLIFVAHVQWLIFVAWI